MNAIEVRMMMETVIEFLVDPESGEVLSKEEAEKKLQEYGDAFSNLIEGSAKWCAEQKYKVAAMKEQRKTLDKMIKTKENLIDRLENYLMVALDKKKYESEDGLVKISYRTTKDTVTVDDINQIPIEFFKTPRYETNLAKTDLKDAILNGNEIPGVHLEDNTSIIIKG